LRSLSIFPEPITGIRALRGTVVAAIAGICLAGTAHALNPAKDLAQYVHDRWSDDKGFVGGAVFAICQSQDGYLWIGTERGLVRFDGFEFTLIQQPIAGLPFIGSVRGLVTDAHGTMWIRPDGSHLLLYRNGKFENAMARFGLHEIAFTAMALDSRGELLLWGPQNRLLRFHNGQFRAYAVSPDIPGIVISAAETPEQKLLMGTRELGLVQVDHGRSTNVSGRLALTSVNTILPAESGSLWIGTDAGLELLDQRGLTNPAFLAPLAHLQILDLARDRNGNVWVGTGQGLIRITPSSSVSAELLDHKSDSEVTAIYEDRDGDIWFGGPHGIERLRDGMFTGYSSAQGLPNENAGCIYADADDRVWFAPLAGGLYWLKGGYVGRITIDGLDKDVVYSIDGGGDEVWLGRQRGGLTQLTRKGNAFVARTFTQADGLLQNSVYSVHRDRDGTVWAGTVSAGVSRLRNGVFTNYSVANGLESNAIFSIVEGQNNTMWFATPGGLESFAGGEWKNFTLADGLPSSNVRSIFEDSNHALWIATSNGLAFLAKGHIFAPKYVTDALREEIFGITEDRQGFLWIATSDHVLQVARDRLLNGSLTESDVQSYGTEDGLPGVQGVRRDRSVVTGSNGHIWLSLTRGLATADPFTIARNAAPVTVRIATVSAGGKMVNLTDSATLSPGTRSVTFNYADSNLSVPQRVRFRYTLDGSGQPWSDDVALRQVVFTNLGPGAYRFRIVASNGAGLWNGPETVVPFVVAPALWQTWWFRIVCLAMGCVAIIAMYRLRMAQLTQRLNVRFNDRLTERTRIAQELHDTLLQGVLSANLQLDVVEDRTPQDSPTKPMLKRVLELLSQVTREGRDALRGLRTADRHSLSLEASLSRVCQEFAADEKTSYRVASNAASRSLRPLIRDEIYRIGREAVVNAFLHAQASRIEVQLEYANRFIRLLVRDDGCGIDTRILDTGREGHWGLLGMRERSESIGATLKLRSRNGAGTEVELTVPATVAYESQSPTSVFWGVRWPDRSGLMPWAGRKRTEKTHEHTSPDSRL
jgi:signal transduction histidine kinase/ligand-binding sensor domain-containing protein